MTTALTLNQLVDHAIDHARRTLIGRNDTQVQPIFHIQFKDRPPAVMLAPWQNEKEKSAFIHALRGSMKAFRDRIVSYSFASEAWVADEDPDHPTGLLPEEREDKREAVLITASDGRTCRVLALAISRDDQGRVTALNEDKHDMGRLGGRLLNLLDEEGEPNGG